MKRAVSIAFVAAVVVVCVAPLARGEVKASKEGLHGTWAGKVEIDEAALKGDELFKKIPAGQADFVLQQIKQQFAKGSMNITFGNDGKMSAELNFPGVTAKDRNMEGTWEVVKTEGPKITVKIKGKDRDDKHAGEMEFTCLDEKKLTATIPGEAGKAMPKGILVTFTKK